MMYRNLFSASERGMVAILLAAALVFPGVYASACDSPSLHGTGASAGSDFNDLKAVRVFSQREDGLIRFFVDNRELCEITMTFELSLVNLSSSVGLPHTATFAPGVTEAFVLRAENPGRDWDYNFTNYYKLGSHVASHDDQFTYQLPYAPGAKFQVTQAANGAYSHKGSNRNAIDWRMPVGTPVHAARGGVVVKIKGDSNLGGPGMEFDKYNNYVLIRHDDGTLGHYCHLQKGGIVVAPGQVVEIGDLIAHSGNTGFSSGPHLHFAVFKTRDGRQRESLPLRFRSTDSERLVLSAGKSYRAAGLPSRAARVVATSNPSTHNES
jgi:hypothetical protein